MSRATEPPPRPSQAGDPIKQIPPAASPDLLREGLAGRHVCPFCGTSRDTSGQPCPRCTMEDTPATRQATKARIGPWFVLQTRNPAAPGMKFSTLLALVSKGQVTGRSIVRGPTTHQLWRFAAHVRGLSREFGLCYSCGETLVRAASICSHCERSQEPPTNPDALLESKEAGAPMVSVSVPSAQSRAGGVAAASHALPTPVAPPTGSNGFQSRELASSSAAAASNGTPLGEHAERLRQLNASSGSRAPRSDMARRDSRVVSGLDLAAAMHPDADDVDDQPTALRRVAGVLVLIALILTGIAFYQRPEYRQMTIDWSRTKIAEAQQWWRGVRGNPDSTGLVAADPSKSAQGAAVTGQRPANGSPAAKEGESRVGPPLASASEPGVTAIPAGPRSPNPEPAVDQAQGTRESAARPDGVKRQSTPPVDGKETRAPEPPKEQPKPGNDANANSPGQAPISLDAAIDQARQLWGRALDAEGKDNFPEAVRCYEEIKRLPQAAWPTGLQLRLNQAKAEAGR